MFWIIVLGLALVVAMLAMAFMAYLASVISKGLKIDRRVREQGRPLLASVVMVNQEIHDPEGMEWNPGVVVFGSYEPSPQLANTLKSISARCHEFYSAPQVDSFSPECRTFALELKNHQYHQDRRYRVPAEIAGSAVVYVADLSFTRNRMPSDWQEHRAVACAVTGTEQGEIALFPLDDPAAVQIYSAAGVGASSIHPTQPKAFGQAQGKEAANTLTPLYGVMAGCGTVIAALLIGIVMLIGAML